MRYISKPRWASVKITSSDSAIVCLSSCLYFENIGQLAEAIKKRQIRAKHWVISIPDRLCIQKTIELPALSMEQAYKMLEFELSSHLPLPAEELVYGCVPVSKNGNLIKVSVYILKIKSLKGILAKFKSIGIRPARVMVDSIAAQRWFNQDGKNAEITLLFGKDNLSLFAAKDGSLQRQEEISFRGSGLEGKREHITEQVNHLAAEITVDKPPVLKIAVSGDIQAQVKSWFNGNFTPVKLIW